MVRAKVQKNALDWIYSGKTKEQRIAEAQTNAEMAKKLFDNNAPFMQDIIDAIDSESKPKFAKACQQAGITAQACQQVGISDIELIDRMWDATMGSLDPQSYKPCW
jgi:hypothetical protein